MQYLKKYIDECYECYGVKRFDVRLCGNKNNSEFCLDKMSVFETKIDRLSLRFRRCY